MRTSPTSGDAAAPRRGILQRFAQATAPNPGVARALEILFYVLVAVALAATCAGVALVAAAPVTDEIRRAVRVGFVIVAGGAVITLISRLAELYGQRARDIDADKIFLGMRGGAEPVEPYSLYLRPFASTDAIAEQGVSATLPGVGVAFSGERFELEAQVERATRRLGRLIGLGAQGEHIGAGRVTVGEQEWRDAVRTLMQNARLIVMLPSARPGTLEEIDMVLSTDLVRKTVFLDPPNLSARARFDHASEWEAVQAAFTQRGYTLPAEDRRGALLYYGEEKAPALKERLHIDAEDNIERLFGRVIKQLTRGNS